MAKNKQPKDKEESLMEAVIMVIIAFVVLFALVWVIASNKIAYYSAPGLWYMGYPWSFINADKWNVINEGYMYIRQNPKKIGFAYYMQFANLCLRPLAAMFGLVTTAYIASLFFGKDKKGGVKRALSPMQAATEISRLFPAIIPVLHLGPLLVKNKLHSWRRQTFPEDVWMNEKVNKKPLVEKGVLHTGRVTTYFRGGEEQGGKPIIRNGLRYSKMLGFQVVDLTRDARTNESIVFPDRFSPQGKVLFALFCAHAFGGRDGKKDYQKACDQLNRTCAGASEGLPNLTVAQWIYDKYRNNESARKLFAIHHWEYSYLYVLFKKAKANGKATHTEFIWLKPLDRILFYVLNTVGRFTPPVEAAAVFAQVDYETSVAKAGRLPLVMRADGKFEHHIAVGTAVEALSTEFERYQNCTDDDGDWWMHVKTWDAAKEQVRKVEADAQVLKEIAEANRQALQAVEAARKSDEQTGQAA